MASMVFRIIWLGINAPFSTAHSIEPLCQRDKLANAAKEWQAFEQIDDAII